MYINKRNKSLSLNHAITAIRLTSPSGIIHRSNTC